MRLLQYLVVSLDFGIDEVVFEALFDEGHNFQLVGLRLGDDALNIELRVGGDELARAGGNIDREQAGRVGVEAGADPNVLVVGSESEDATEGLVRPPLDQLAPRRGDLVAHADDGASVRRRYLRRASPQVVIGLPGRHVTGILRVHRDLAGLQIEVVYVEHLRVALVALEQNGVRSLPVIGDNVDPDLVERRQVFGLLGGNVGLVEPPVFVAAHVLGVEDMLVVILPGEIADAAFGVRRHGAIVGLAQGADPDVEHAIGGCKIAKLGAVGRDLGIGALRIAEEHGPGNDLGGQLLLSGRGRCERCELNHHQR